MCLRRSGFLILLSTILFIWNAIFYRTYHTPGCNKAYQPLWKPNNTEKVRYRQKRPSYEMLV